MKYELLIDGELYGIASQDQCYDAVHRLGAELTGESYTISYNAATKMTELLMEHADMVVACVSHLGIMS